MFASRVSRTARIESSIALLQGALLREALRRALRTSLLSSLGVAAALEIAACAPPKQVTVHPADPGASASGADAGPVGGRPACDPPGWRLADGFKLARAVDYVADRNGDMILSASGTPCASAGNHERCLADMSQQGMGRHLETTEADVVRLWPGDAVKTLFGDIDSAEEALFILATRNYKVFCTSVITSNRDGYSFTDASRTSNCANVRWLGTVGVERDGTVVEVTGTAVPQVCVNTGRRPEGLVSEHLACGSSLVGDHFATIAHLEAAAVPAFSTIAAELAHHGAPDLLRHAALRARRDEVLHARLASRLALRHLTRSTPPVIEPMPLRDLYAFALDNAIEGCVHETYAALEAGHQALTARDPEIRRVMRRIAADETRHAELAWQIARWVAPRLRDHQRSELRRRQVAAVEALGERLRVDVHPTLTDVAGVPSAAHARELHASLAGDLWSSALARELA